MDCPDLLLNWMTQIQNFNLEATINLSSEITVYDNSSILVERINPLSKNY